MGESNKMKKQGLVKCVQTILSAPGLSISTLVTDRHPQIIKYVREQLPDTEHAFDVWHVAKGLSKRLVAIGKKKNCFIINPWIKSVINHLYWCAASSHGMPKNVIVAKWKSNPSNIHSHKTEDFTVCVHGDLGPEKACRIKWLQLGSEVYHEFERLAKSNRHLKDVSMLSTLHQTSNLEAFHSLLIQFSPKLQSFSYREILIT